MDDCKYMDLATQVREQLPTNMGVVLVVFERGATDPNKTRAHISIHVDYCIREKVPQCLADLTKRLDDELRLERLADLFDHVQGDTPEAN